MNDPAALLKQSASSGVYVTPDDVTAMREAAVALGLAWFELDMHGVVDKARFMARSRVAFMLPPDFGDNWDALADCLGDLAWKPAAGYVVHCRRIADFARHAPDEYATALEVFAGAAEYWAGCKQVFIVLVDTDAAGKSGIRKLPGQ